MGSDGPCSLLRHVSQGHFNKTGIFPNIFFVPCIPHFCATAEVQYHFRRCNMSVIGIVEMHMAIMFDNFRQRPWQYPCLYVHFVIFVLFRSCLFDNHSSVTSINSSRCVTQSLGPFLARKCSPAVFGSLPHDLPAISQCIPYLSKLYFLPIKFWSIFNTTIRREKSWRIFVW